MAVFRCKMCGASLDVVPGMEICECESCGTVQTLPKFDDDRRVTMYERANHFRRNNEFDKAMGMYEQILNEDRTDAEAYWSIVLCRYGIEYVEDPVTKKRIPTVNRSQYASIFADEDYKEAINYASTSQKILFENEAKAIDDIQKGILEISQKEEPFDVFICYKESDANGNRTYDSVLATDIYYSLVKEGLKVFFAAITLEDKLGQAYEPYIFAALNSAKVMIVLGTRPEYFNAVWVKNEWSRFLAIIKKDPKKILIPAYKDMDAYDLPEEFSFLQAQDMGKIGFMVDLIHGIKKIVSADEVNNSKPATVVKIADSGNSDNGPSGKEALLKRAFFFIEDANWSNAMLYCKKALDIDPACAEAYIGQLMVELRVHKEEDLVGVKQVFTHNDNFVRACRFADEKTKKKLEEYDQKVCASILADLRVEMEKTHDERVFNSLVAKAEKLRGHEGVEEFIRDCNDRKEECRKELIYTSAERILGSINTVDDYDKVVAMLEQIQGYKDSNEILQRVKDEIRQLEINDKTCSICRKWEATKRFIPDNETFKCCTKCYARLEALYQRGTASTAANTSLDYFSELLPMIRVTPVKTRVEFVMNKYIASVPSLAKRMDEKKEKVREKTPWEIEEERRKKEELIRKETEAKRAEIARKKQSVIEKNAMYEYDMIIVQNKVTGGTDFETVKQKLDKSASEGWQLKSIIYNDNNGTFIGQTVLVFERRIKEQA